MDVPRVAEKLLSIEYDLDHSWQTRGKDSLAEFWKTLTGRLNAYAALAPESRNAAEKEGLMFVLGTWCGAS